MNAATCKRYVLSIVTIIIMIGFGRLTPIEPITPMGMKILGVFIGCIFGWLTVDVFWPSILGLILLGFTGFGTIPEDLKYLPKLLVTPALRCCYL